MKDYDPFDLRAQRQAVLESERRNQYAQSQEALDLRWLMESEKGRRIIWRLLTNAGLWASSFNPNALVMAYQEGQREFAVRVFAVIEQHCPEALSQMIQENRTDGRNDSNSRQPD